MTAPVPHSSPATRSSSAVAAAPQAPRRIGPFSLPLPIGLGCMNLSHAYGKPPPVEQAERLLLTALDQGVSLIDTAALYGFGANETLVGRVLKPHRNRITLCSKGGLAGVQFDDGVKRVIDGRPLALRRNVEDSLKRLQTDTIDLYYLHRWDKKVPIEESVGEMARFVQEGKVRALGLSEVSAATLRRAHTEHPIVAVQTEYSLWTRNPQLGVLQACADLGAAFVAFSPVGRGFLTGSLPLPAEFEAKDIRATMPRFAPEHWPTNLRLHAPLQALAHEAGCSVAQLALAWLLAQGGHIVPIPGTTQVAHLQDNLGAINVEITPKVMADVNALLNERTVSGGRYNAQADREVDTEVFAA